MIANSTKRVGIPYKIKHFIRYISLSFIYNYSLCLVQNNFKTDTIFLELNLYHFDFLVKNYHKTKL